MLHEEDELTMKALLKEGSGEGGRSLEQRAVREKFLKVEDLAQYEKEFQES